jgi:hypothetical protein
MRKSHKSVLATAVCVSAAASALAQGTVIFENELSSGNITLYSANGPLAAAGTYTVVLLWAAGNTLNIHQSAFTQIATYGPAGTATGFFSDPSIITTGAATAPGTVAVFEVQGWLGNYANYAAAIAGGSAVGQTGEFLNATGNPHSPTPAPVQTTGWDGNLIIGDPEPSTLAIAGVGVGVWVYLRRRKK